MSLLFGSFLSHTESLVPITIAKWDQKGNNINSSFCDFRHFIVFETSTGLFTQKFRALCGALNSRTRCKHIL